MKYALIKAGQITRVADLPQAPALAALSSTLAVATWRDGATTYGMAAILQP